MPRRLTLGCVADGIEGLQTARVHGVHGGVRLDALVGGGTDACLVLDALAGEAAGEVQHALLLLDLLDGLADGSDGVQLAIGVEGIELAVVGDEAGGVVRGFVCGAAFVAQVVTGTFAPVVLADGLDQGCLVVGEVLVHAEACDQTDRGREIGRRHFVGDVILGGVHCAGHVLRLHAAEVEEHDDQTAVLQLIRFGGEVVVHQVGDGLFLGGCDLGGGGAGDGARLGQGDCQIDVLVVEGGNVLRLLVFGDGKVLRLEALDEFAGFLVAHHDVGQHTIDVCYEGRGFRVRGRLRTGCQGHSRR